MARLDYEQEQPPRDYRADSELQIMIRDLPLAMLGKGRRVDSRMAYVSDPLRAVVLLGLR
jgi:hypothetical protein